jgi:hypothetical protein
MVSAFGNKRPHIWYPWPMHSPISTTSSHASPKLLSMQRKDSIELYQLESLQRNNDETDVSKLTATESYKYSIQTNSLSTMMGKIELGGVATRLLASQLSPNGKFLAVSNGSSMFVFHLNCVQSKENDMTDEFVLQPTKLKLPESLHTVNATAFYFEGDTLFVADSSKHQIHMVHLKSDTVDDEEELQTSTFSFPSDQQMSKNEIRLPIESIHTSHNGNFLVTTSHLKEDGVHVFMKDGDTYRHYWTIPSLGGYDARAAAVTMIGESCLAVATYQSRIYVFDLPNKKLNPWSEQYGFPIESNKWTEDLLCRRDFPVRLMANPTNEKQLLLVSRMSMKASCSARCYSLEVVFHISSGLSILPNDVLPCFSPVWSCKYTRW